MKKTILILMMFIISINVYSQEFVGNLPKTVSTKIDNSLILDENKKIIYKIPKSNVKLEVDGYNKNYLKVRLDTINGFIYYLSVIAFSEEWRNYFTYSEKFTKTYYANIRKLRLESKYNKIIVDKLIHNEIWIGMSTDMLIDSIGQPTSINETVTEYANLTQYVYPNKYVYIQNNKVTIIQLIN